MRHTVPVQFCQCAVMKTFSLSSVLLLSAIVCSSAAEAPVRVEAVVVSPQWIDELTAEARTNHPALRAADLRADAATWNAASVRTWEDPMARFGVMGADRERRADDGDLIYGVEQKLPLFGKAQAMRAMVQAEATTQRHEAMFRSVQLRRDLHRQALKLALTERTLELSREDLVSLELLVTTTEEKYRNGLAIQVEVLTSQNERARRSNLVRTDETLLRAERASLERLLNRSTNSNWPKLLLPGAATNLPPVELMIEHATTMAPQLDVMRGSLRQAELSARLARTQRMPDVTLGVDARQYSGSGDFREGVVSAGISLPWGNRSRYAADIKREQLKAQATQLEIADMQLALREEIVRLAAQIENARREVWLYRDDITPRTELAVNAARINWLNNRGTLRDVLDTRRMWIEARAMEARALAEQHVMLSELAMHCGVEDLEQLAAKHTQPVPSPKGTKP